MSGDIIIFDEAGTLDLTAEELESLADLEASVDEDRLQQECGK